MTTARRDARRGRRGWAALAGAMLLVSLTSCSSDKTTPVTPAAVLLSPEFVPADLKIGVVVTLTGPVDQGTQWRDSAEGATVAAYRYQLGNADVEIVPASDNGSTAGAKNAVDELIGEDVAGIVFATSGEHVLGGVARATAAKVPVLLPYASGLKDIPAGAWATGPTGKQVGAALNEAMRIGDITSPVFVDVGGGDIPGVDSTTSISVAPRAASKGIAKKLRRALRDSTSDSIVISGPAELQAKVLRALQESKIEVPVLLSSDALSPRLASTLAQSGGSLAAPLTTAGVANGDVTALESGSNGEAVSAYLAGVRAAAEDGDVTDFFDDRSFAAVSHDVDVTAHDAVIALVTAATKAGSADAADVLQSLGELRVEQSDGLGGPALDFTRSAAVADEDVVPLQSSTQDPGLRTTGARADAGRSGAGLFWFGMPTT